MTAFYSSDIDVSQAQTHLRALDASLTEWYSQLPLHLAFTPWADNPLERRYFMPPNIMNLHNTYHSLVILLNRPFVSERHLRSLEQNADVAAACWKKCTAAARNITMILASYRDALTLRGAPYAAGFAAYCSCTIHVRNAALEKRRVESEHLKLLLNSLRALDELSTPNPSARRPASIIRRLMQDHGLEEPQGRCFWYYLYPLLRNFAGSSPFSILDFDPASAFDIQSPSLEPLFDTFMFDGQDTTHWWDTGASNSDNLAIANDSLYGFMNHSDLLQ